MGNFVFELVGGKKEFTQYLRGKKKGFYVPLGEKTYRLRMPAKDRQSLLLTSSGKRFSELRKLIIMKAVRAWAQHEKPPRRITVSLDVVVPKRVKPPRRKASPRKAAPRKPPKRVARKVVAPLVRETAVAPKPAKKPNLVFEPDIVERSKPKETRRQRRARLRRERAEKRRKAAEARKARKVRRVSTAFVIEGKLPKRKTPPGTPGKPATKRPAATPQKRKVSDLPPANDATVGRSVQKFKPQFKRIRDFLRAKRLGAKTVKYKLTVAANGTVSKVSLSNELDGYYIGGTPVNKRVKGLLKGMRFRPPGRALEFKGTLRF